MMSVSDWISIICAGVALIVTVIIAVLQIRQRTVWRGLKKGRTSVMSNVIKKV